MRIVDRVHHDRSSLGPYTCPEYSAPLAGPAPACKGPASGDASLQPRFKSTTSRHPITTAMSWLVALLIEAGAAYGEAIYPGLLVLTALNHDQELVRDSQRRCQDQVEYRRELPWRSAPQPLHSEDFARSAKAHTTPAGLNAWVSSIATRVWANRRCKRQAWLTIADLEALDDRTLRDIGIHRSRTESIVRHGDRYEW
jgi:hypothetical protein